MLRFFISALCLLIFTTQSLANTSAVVLQYHHVSEDTPASTSITPEQLENHIQWINENGFEVLPLPEVVSRLKAKKEFSRSKVLAISFDDANSSVCEIAWPILKKHNLPFTVFISTEAVDKNYASQCSWEALKEMSNSGLMTPANHSHQHLHMVSNALLKKPDWLELMKAEILLAQKLIESELGHASKLFAYPFGEFNASLSKLVTDLGFTGFGQQSGALGHQSDFSALPRFPASSQFADLDTLSTKLYSLAFPARLLPIEDNPISLDSPKNPPKLKISPTDEQLLKTTNCYNSQGESLPTSIDGKQLLVQSAVKLETGRHRYTCTSESGMPNRFYWLSHQWLIE